MRSMLLLLILCVVTLSVKGQVERAARQKRFDPGDFENAETEDEVQEGCEPGYIENSDGSCAQCTPGTYAPEEGSTCVACPLGTYQPSAATTSCLKCEEGASTHNIGSRNKEDCVVSCTLPDKVYKGVLKVEEVDQEEGGTVLLGTKVTLSCNHGYKFNDSALYEMSCNDAASTFYNQCYKVTALPEEAVFEMKGDIVIVTCRVESSHDVIGLHLVHDTSKFNVEATSDREFEDGVAEQMFKFTSSKGAVGDVRCMADVKEDFFETSNNFITVGLLDVSITPATLVKVGDFVAISALVTYDERLSVVFSWTKNGEEYHTVSTSQTPVSMDGSTFFKSEASLTSAGFNDDGIYKVLVQVKDAEGKDRWVKELQTEVAIHGFIKQPSDEEGDTIIVNSGQENVKLTCAYQRLTHSQDIRWVDESNKPFHEDWQTSEEDDKVTISILQFEEWPQDLSDTQIMCAVFDGDDLLYESDQISLLSHEYEVQMGPDVDATLGEDAKLTCTASSPEHLDHLPTVTWYKKNGGSEDLFLEDGKHFITNNKLDGISLLSTLTIATVDQNDLGQYYCMAQYEEPAYIEVIGEDLITLSEGSGEEKCDILQQNVENGKFVKKSTDGGRLRFTVECDPGYWLSNSKGNLLYCNSTILPECERVIIKTSIVAHNEGSHLVQVSYTSKSWNGNGTLCDDGWDNREAGIICRQNGFKYGKAISLVTDREDFVLTGLDCPCDEKENLEHCSATRYEDSELPCLPEETAGVRCYNQSTEIIGTFLKKTASKKKAYKIFLSIEVNKFGEPFGLTRLHSSSFEVKSQSVKLKTGKASVKVKEGAAFVTLIAKKPKGHGRPNPDCLTVEMEGPANGQHHEFEHCF
ncbi:uncharacterized protein LOC134816595 [Bolinopsis microptera]|uniref:uncharacterized protein LOC134816595 n=1 Tax=Bolinopsis microptera TaxID=2820187 RepID=UPI00307A7B86